MIFDPGSNRDIRAFDRFEAIRLPLRQAGFRFQAAEGPRHPRALHFVRSVIIPFPKPFPQPKIKKQGETPALI
ncbi:MAG: hypothetical protein C6W57_02010 [Caldibacillus debilis]|nr:hypothetical protein [Bacillaceae bacterium]OUM92795.1 MAG: hypothetical protein BAA03_13465 [Caldibacillus debilis]REJ19110.1 MAG: hypothetical protein C6W57_02010 [Caldibacillus debilis]